MPHLYIIAGCNGAGKTTASYSILPNMLSCTEFVNADEIAKGLSPFNPEDVAIEAGKLMILRIGNLLNEKKDFAIETTLATRSYVRLIQKAHEAGYSVSLIYFWLNSPKLAVHRVAERVKHGGHNIPTDVVRRRYRLGIHNLLHLFCPIVDFWLIIDNSVSPPDVIAEGKPFSEEEEKTVIYNQDKYIEITSYETSHKG